MNAVFVRRILIHKTGKIVNAIFVYPIEEEFDFEQGAAWMEQVWPITQGEADA